MNRWRFIIVFFMLLFCFFDYASAITEERGLWIVRNTLNKKADIQKSIDLAKASNFNALFGQVCGRGDAYYSSSILPRAESLVNNRADFDPLAYVIQQAHAADLDVHAWINVFYIWSAPNAPRSQSHVYHAQPEWAAVDRDGRSMRDYSMQDRKKLNIEGVYIAPGNPQVRDHLRAVIGEILENYDVDGIHLDYVRYPGGNYSFDRMARNRFERKAGVDPFELINNRIKMKNTESFLAKVDEWNIWRANQVTRLVRALYYDVRRQKPEIKFSAAVIADLDLAYYRFGQKWSEWLSEGIIDFVVPMAYTSKMKKFNKYIREAKGIKGDRHIYMGIGVWNQPFENALKQVNRCREEAIPGIVIFSHNAMLEHPERFNILRNGVFRQVAVRPGMPWKEIEIPQLVIEDELEFKMGQPKWAIPTLILD